jgi:hypothetical protein
VEQPANQEPDGATRGTRARKRWHPLRESAVLEKARPRITNRPGTMSHEIQRYCVAKLRLRVAILRSLPS